MRKGFRSLPARITAAILTAGLIVSSSNLDYVRFVLPGVQNVSQVEAGDQKISLQDKNLQTAMNVIVNYNKKHGDVSALKGADLLKADYDSYKADITVNEANTYSGIVDLSGCKGEGHSISDLSGMKIFKGITEINVSNYIGDTIPEEAFEDCLSLEKVTISDKVINIEKDAFNGCNSLASIDVSGSEYNDEYGKDEEEPVLGKTLNLCNVTNIGEHAFDSVSSFKYVYFNSAAKKLKLGANAFSRCTSLVKIDLPTEDAEQLSESVFSECDALTYVKLKDQLESIPSNFFFDSNLSEMDHFPTGLKLIGQNSFADTNLLIPDLSGCTKLELIDQGAFQGIGYTFDKDHTEFKLPNNLAGAGELSEAKGIKRIAFACSSLPKINIPKDITVLQDSLFEGCIYLTDVSIPADSKLKEIRKWAFRRCDRLPNTDFIKDLPYLESIEDYAFCECYSIREIYKDGKKVPEQDDYKVYNVVSGIKTVTLPASLKEIGICAFANNYNLEEISMGDNIKEIPESAFSLRAATKHQDEYFRVSGFTEVHYSNLDKVLLGYASKLSKVTLSKNLESIGIDAFRYNPYLETVSYNGLEEMQDKTLELPSSVVSIGDYAFADCARWQVDIDVNGDKVVDSSEYKMGGLKKVDLTDLHLTEFGKGVFANDYILGTAILPKDLIEIPSELFSDCGKRIDKTNKDNNNKKEIVGFYGLHDVTFPDNVEKISDKAFYSCENFVYNTEDKLDGRDAGGKPIKFNKLPLSLKEIGSSAFFGCQNIGKIAFNLNITNIGKDAFRECSIKNLNPPKNLPETSFESGESGYYGLTAVSFTSAEKLETIGESAFFQTAIDKADLSNNILLLNIPAGLFSDCYNLKSSILPDTSTKVGAKVYQNDVKLTSVKLPTIATINSNIFSGISVIDYGDEEMYDIYGYFGRLNIAPASQSGKSLIKVPLGKEIKLDFIRSETVLYNNYSNVQKSNGKRLTEEKDMFVSVREDNGNIYLKGELETPDNSELSITNNIEFEVYNYEEKKSVTRPKSISKDYTLTVSEQYANELKITGVDKGATVQTLDDNTDVIYLSSDVVNESDDKNKVKIFANVLPVPLTKAPVWGSDDPDIISVEEADNSDEEKVKALLDSINKSNKTEAVLHVKKFGTAKIWVASKTEGEDIVKKEVTVKVVYPINGVETTVQSLESDKNNYQLETGSTDSITIVPTYPDVASDAGDDVKASYFYESTDPSVATVDRATGEVKAQEKTGKTVIKVYDDTGKTLKEITLNVVEVGSLSPNSIKITPQTGINIYENESFNANAEVFPKGVALDKKGYTWSIKDSNIAEIVTNEDGSVTVKGKALGNTKLRATSTTQNDVCSEVDVNVSVPAANVKFQIPEAQVAVGNTLKIPTTTKTEEKVSFLYEPENAKKDTITWKIGDESIAQFVNSKDNVIIEKGVPEIKGLKQGVTKLTATTGKGLKAELNISVYNEITEFSVPEKKSVHIGDSFKLDVSKTPADSSEKVTFTSSKDAIATVDENGVVKGISEGTATITVSRANGKKVSCAVSVVEKVSQITILDGALEIGVDKTYKIGRASDDEKAKTGYRLTPKSSDELTWSTSNSAVASVEFSKGTVTIKGVAPGTATITATSLSGQTAAINATVVSSTNEIKFTEESIKVAINTQAALTLVRDPADSSETVEYTTSDEKKATVDDNGVVTGVEKGEVTITATTKVSKKSAKIKVIITVPATKVQAVTNYASEKKIYLVKGNTYKLRYKILPEESTDTVTFSTNKKKIAPISEDGTITAKKKGNATITIKTESGKTAKVKVYVVNKEKACKKIKIKTSSIKVGKTVRLKYTVTAATTTNSVRYSIDKPQIASIDEFGYITGLKKGKVKVTITMSNGKAKTKTIKVKK